MWISDGEKHSSIGSIVKRDLKTPKSVMAAGSGQVGRVAEADKIIKIVESSFTLLAHTRKHTD